MSLEKVAGGNSVWVEGSNRVVSLYSFNKAKVVGNKDETNNILVDEVLLLLGYDKKLGRAVRDYIDADENKFDWVVTKANSEGVEEHIMAITVVPYENREDGIKSIKIPAGRELSIYVLTDGLNISVYSNLSGVRADWNIVVDVENIDILSRSRFHECLVDKKIIERSLNEETVGKAVDTILSNRHLVRGILSSMLKMEYRRRNGQSTEGTQLGILAEEVCSAMKAHDNRNVKEHLCAKLGNILRVSDGSDILEEDYEYVGDFIEEQEQKIEEQEEKIPTENEGSEPRVEGDEQAENEDASKTGIESRDVKIEAVEKEEGAILQSGGSKEAISGVAVGVSDSVVDEVSTLENRPTVEKSSSSGVGEASQKNIKVVNGGASKKEEGANFQSGGTVVMNVTGDVVMNMSGAVKKSEEQEPKEKESSPEQEEMPVDQEAQETETAEVQEDTISTMESTDGDKMVISVGGEDNGEEESIKGALEMLDILDGEAAMKFMCAVNGKFIQSDDIEEIVSESLGELVKAVGNGLLQYLFDSSVVKIRQPAVRRDININGRAFDIDLEGKEPREIIETLTMLFGKFEDVSFKVKVNSKYKDSIYPMEGDKEETKEDSQEDYYVGIETSGMTFDMWVEMNRLGKVKYAGLSGTGKVVKVQLTSNKDRVNKLTSRIIEALIYLSSNFDSTVDNLNCVINESTSTFIGPNTGDAKENSRIPFGRTYIYPIGIEQAYPILKEIWDMDGMVTDGSCPMIYFAMSSESVREISGDTMTVCEMLKKEEIVLEDMDILDVSKDGETMGAIVSGKALDKIIINRATLAVQEHIFRECKVIKTNYMACNVSQEEVPNIISTILSQGDVINPETFGMVPGTKYRVLSEHASEVGGTANNFITYGDKKVYISDMLEWQLMYVLIRIHTLVCKDKQIGIRMDISKENYEYYLNQYKTADVSTALAVRSLVEYINDRISK